jgi:hypothetical protein
VRARAAPALTRARSRGARSESQAQSFLRAHPLPSVVEALTACESGSEVCVALSRAASRTFSCVRA